MIEFIPLFPSIANLQIGNQQSNAYVTSKNTVIDDATYSYELALEFLMELRNNKARYDATRTCINIFYNYVWEVEKISICDVGRVEFRRFMDFSISPPVELISSAPYSMFLNEHTINPDWKPFTSRGSIHEYKRTDSSIKTQLSVLSSLYGFLHDEGYVDKNPPAMFAKRTNLRNNENVNVVDEEKERALSDRQWTEVWSIVCELASENPAHIRTKFMFAMFYLLYLRVSELSARAGYEPTMNLFSQHHNENNWTFFVPRSKHGRSRRVMCPPDLIELLKEYRLSLGLSELPTPTDTTPLFPRWTPARNGRKAGELHATLGKDRIQEIVKEIFQMAYERLLHSAPHEAADMLTFSAHSLRHYGIQKDLELERPQHHVMSDAGHKDLSTLSRYSKSNKTDRYKSAQAKKLE